MIPSHVIPVLHVHVFECMSCTKLIHGCISSSSEVCPAQPFEGCISQFSEICPAHNPLNAAYPRLRRYVLHKILRMLQILVFGCRICSVQNSSSAARPYFSDVFPAYAVLSALHTHVSRWISIKQAVPSNAPPPSCGINSPTRQVLHAALCTGRPPEQRSACMWDGLCCHALLNAPLGKCSYLFLLVHDAVSI